MASKKMTLPTAGSTNWGMQLNGYLEWLECRLTNLSVDVSNIESGFVGGSGGGIAATGWTKLDKFTVEEIEEVKKISISGWIGMGGYAKTADYFIDIAQSPQGNGTGVYYQFLKYNAGGDGEQWEWTASETFSWDITSVLVGLAYFEKGTFKSFFPYVQIAGTTLSQHKHNLDNLWADMDNMIVSLLGSTPSIEVTGTYTVKGAYIGLEDTYTKNLFYGGPQSVELSANSNITYYREVIDVNGKYSIVGAGGLTKGDIGRVLLDVFGNVVVVLANANTPAISNNELDNIANRVLYNTQFFSVNSDNLCLQGESTSISNHHFLELCRFGITKEVDDKAYKGLGYNSEYANEKVKVPNGLFLVKSMNNGVIYQQSMNAWAPQTAIIDLQNYSFQIKDAKSYRIQTNAVDKSVLNINCSSWAGGTVGSGDSAYYEYLPLWEKHSTANSIELTSTNDAITLSGKNGINLWGSDQYNSEVKIGQAFLRYTTKSFDSVLLLSSKNSFSSIEISQYYSGENGSIVGHGNVLLKASSALTTSIEIQTINDNEQSVSNIVCAADTIKLEGTSKSAEATLQIPYTLKLATHVVTQPIFSSDLGFNFKTGLYGLSLREDDGLSISDSNGVFCQIKRNNIVFKDYLELTDSKATFSVDINLNEGKIIQYLSDRRLKENIIPLAKTYSDTILNTPIVKYNYVNNDEPQIGIIAQDLEATLSSDASVFVKQSNQRGYEDCRTIAETKLVYILWKGLQEEIEARKQLEQELQKLKQKIGEE